MAKVLKEYEKITIVKQLTRQGLKEEIELITRLTYTPKDGGKGWIIPVSYTHLTLPTNREV